MAAKDRPASDHLSFLASLGAKARRYGVFPLLRTAEAMAVDLERIGRSHFPSQNIVDLAHTPGMDFPGPTVDEIEASETDTTGKADAEKPKILRFRVRSRFLGLTGPMGPLPVHLSEYAHYERRYRDKRPFGAFLDLLTDRMLQFFFRSWADSQPAVQADRPKDDRFANYIAYLSGAGDNVADGASFPVRARLHYAALYTGRRSAGALQDSLSHLLARPIKLIEFIGRRRTIVPEDRTRIGASGAFQEIGRGAMVGSRVRQLDDTFRVVATARNMADYRAMLPGGPWFRIAREGLAAFAPTHLDWELELAIPEHMIEPVCLDGSGRLGLTSWVASTARPDSKDGNQLRADARLRRRH